MKISDVLQHNPCVHGVETLLQAISPECLEKVKDLDALWYEDWVEELDEVLADLEFTYEDIMLVYNQYNVYHRDYLAWLLLNVPYPKLEEYIRDTYQPQEVISTYTKWYFLQEGVTYEKLRDLATMVYRTPKAEKHENK